MHLDEGVFSTQVVVVQQVDHLLLDPTVHHVEEPDVLEFAFEVDACLLVLLFELETNFVLHEVLGA